MSMIVNIRSLKLIKVWLLISISV